MVCRCDYDIPLPTMAENLYKFILLKSAIVSIALVHIFIIISSSTAQFLPSCGRDKFACRSGQCITLHYACDGGKDCNDGSDEATCDCTNTPFCFNKAPVCKAGEFRCKNGDCIPSDWLCDGHNDCLDFSDETSNCGNQTCSQFEFTCDNGFCIDARLKCNLKNDCGDNSDEAVCQIISSSSDKSCGNAFRCKDGTCIPFEQVCDAHTQHCPDGSDEGGKCNDNCTQCQLPTFQRTPTGCLCRCPKNYRLAGDDVTCVDIQECNRNPPTCSQLCKEVQGSYSCGCFYGFRLGQDNKTCRSTGSPMSIYHAVRNEIRQYVPRRSLRIKHIETNPIASLEIDIYSGLMYYALQNDDSLYQLATANNSRKSIVNVGAVSLLTLDWLTGNIYFLSKEYIDPNIVESDIEVSGTTPNYHSPITHSNSTSSARIMMCNFDKLNCANLSIIYDDVTALTIDPIKKYLFYTTVEADNQDDNQPGNLYRASLDFRYTYKIATFNTTITDMTLDYRHEYLYVVRNTGIDRLDYNGAHIMNMVEATTIRGLNVFEDHLYFLSQDGLIMHKCRLFANERRCTTFRLSAEATELFVIKQVSRQIPGRNVCSNYNCNHLCVPTESGAVCVCEDGKIVNETSDCRG